MTDYMLEYRARLVGYRIVKRVQRYGSIKLTGYEMYEIKTGKPVQMGYDGQPYLWNGGDVEVFVKEKFAEQGYDW